jgi:maltose phosphorylase
VDPWLVVETGFEPKKQRVAESIFALANEFMCVRGYFEEGYSGDHLQGCYFNQLYDFMDYRYPNTFRGFRTEGGAMPNAVDWLYTRITLDGEQLDLAKVKFSNFYRVTDMRTAMLRREFIWETASGKKVKLTFERFVNADQTALGCQRITFGPLNFSGSVNIVSGLDFNTIYEIAGGFDHTKEGAANKGSGVDLNFWTLEKTEQIGKFCAIQARTRRTNTSLFSSFRLDSAQKLETKPVKNEAAKFIGVEFSLTLTEGESASFDKLAVNYWQKDGGAEKVWTDGLALARKLSTVTYDAALDAHKQFWSDAWSKMDVEIVGDELMQQGIRYALFIVFMDYHGESERKNVLCKLGGEVYQAERAGVKGARFPFGTVSGKDDTGCWQHCDLEIHQNGAVFYAIWHYVKLTGDKDFLYREGIEMLLQMSRCMASWGGWSPRTGEFGFYGVMGPDEFHMMVNNNTYTNVLGKKLFEYTVEVLAEMRKNAPALYKKITVKLKLQPGEPKDWALMAEKMRVLQDKKTGLYEQHDGYFDMPHIDIKKLPLSLIPIYKNWPYIKIFRYDMLKQPDLLNLLYFFSREYTLKEKRANYEFYEARTIHESSMSPALHSVLAAEIGKLEDTYAFLAYASRLDLDNYNRNTEQGLHSTASSGVWAGVVAGFGGLRTDTEMLSFVPQIPKKWKSYRFRLFYRGSRIEVAIDKKEAIFKTVSGPEVKVTVYGKTLIVDAEGETVKLK